MERLCSPARFIPTFLLFGWLCRRVPLRTLLLWGTVAAVPQMVPLLFVKTVPAALLGGCASGLMGGVATAAYLDLMIRSCPKGLEGTLLMAATRCYAVISQFGNLLGTDTLRALPHLHRLRDRDHRGLRADPAGAAAGPKRLIATPDGQAPVQGAPT